MSFVKRSKSDTSGRTVNPAGGVNPASEPNVGQYGWTSYDAAHVNQIIQYVNMCKNYAKEAEDAATYIQGVWTESQEFIKYIETVYEELKPISDSITIIYADIIVRHDDIKIRHADIITKHGEIDTWYSETKTNADNAKVSADKATVSEVNAGASETGAEGWYDKSYELYEELRKGNIYRGTWNPHTNAYPDNGGTNSTWDVILNESESEFTFDGKTWFWGDRLVYLKEGNMYQQIESGTTVTSVNGKKGAVTLNASDVSALPIAGGELTGALKGTSLTNSSWVRSVGSDSVSIRIINSGGRGHLQSGHETDDDNQKLTISGHATKGLTSLELRMKDGTNPAVRWGSTNHAVYHQGHKPTANDVGAISVNGGRFGIGAKNGQTNEAEYYTEDGTLDLNKLLTSGMYTVAGSWENTFAGASPTNSVGIVRVEVRSYSAGPSYVQTYHSREKEQLKTYTRVGTGSPGSITWSDWSADYTEANKPTAADVGALQVNSEGNIQSRTLTVDLKTFSNPMNIIHTKPTSGASAQGVHGLKEDGSVREWGVGHYYLDGSPSFSYLGMGTAPWGQGIRIHEDEASLFFPTTGERGFIPIKNMLGTVDLNTLSTMSRVGFYGQDVSSVATTARNYPIGEAGTLLVTPSAYGVQQEYTSYGALRKFVRGRTSAGGWNLWREVGAYMPPVALPLNTGYANYADSYDSATYSRHGNFVTVGGLIKATAGAQVVIAKLPAGFRPANRKIFLCAGEIGGLTRVDVLPDGSIQVPAPVTTTSWISLENLSFAGV